MNRDSFIFYKSFYEAIKGLGRDIQLEVYTAIIEYALYGNEPQNLKPIASSIFTLIKPNIDVNTTRYENGKKGGRKGRPKKTASKDDAVAYDLSYGQEVARMRDDAEWRDTICRDFGITPEEYGIRLTRFLQRCEDDRKAKGKERHSSFDDCRSHLRYWMSKAYPNHSPATPESPDSLPFPGLTADSFGAMDYEENR